MRRIWLWGLVFPIAALMGSILHPAALLVMLIYPLQVFRLSRTMGWRPAFFNVLGKFPEAVGALRFYARQLGKGETRLIEYK